MISVVAGFTIVSDFDVLERQRFGAFGSRPVTLNTRSWGAFKDAVSVAAIAFNRGVRAVERESSERVIKFTVTHILCHRYCGCLRQSKAADKHNQFDDAATSYVCC